MLAHVERLDRAQDCATRRLKARGPRRKCDEGVLAVVLMRVDAWGAQPPVAVEPPRTLAPSAPRCRGLVYVIFAKAAHEFLSAGKSGVGAAAQVWSRRCAARAHQSH